MKTSKEMQLKIIDKMRENVENDLALMNGIQYRNRVNSLWDDRVYDVGTSQFKRLEMRIKPETITINGVEIPKPLDKTEILEDVMYYHIENDSTFHKSNMGYTIHNLGIRFAYNTKQEAITASKALFGIKGE